MRLKESLSELIGKIISGVVVGQYPKGNPSSRLFLAFSDGTAFEFWEDDQGLKMAKGLADGSVDQIVEVLERRGGATINIFRPSYEVPETIQQDMLTNDEVPLR